jgi:hypothetical protein
LYNLEQLSLDNTRVAEVFEHDDDPDHSNLMRGGS